ncbi:armadillo-type protein [Cladochytrium replicatum]|nr:armadillo-type protein [Cladochytrium replicatum]
MSDAKYFQRGKIHELRSELVSEKKYPKHAKKKVAMKRIVANMTMGNDMSPLFADVVACMNIPLLEIKKMIYLYLINYSMWKPEMALLAINSFVRIQADKIVDCLCGPPRNCLDDRAPYVAKNAAIAVAKLYMYDRVLVENEGFLDQLRFLLSHDNSTVVATAVAALLEISDRSEKVDLVLDVDIANRLLTAMNESSEYGTLTASKIDAPFEPLSLLLFCKYQKYNTLRFATCFMLLILQKLPEFLRNEMNAFFCNFDDPIYVKISKHEITFRLASDANIDLVLAEFKEYATELDVDFVRKAGRVIDKCVQALVELVETKVNYMVQEAIVVIKDIFQRYPNKYEGVIGTLCESLDSLDEAEAKASMIWILGHYADRIDNADELLTSFLDTSKEEGVSSSDVQLALVTASVKLFLKHPSAGQDLITKVLKWATEDRGFIYWRLLSTDPVAAKAIVLGDTPAISTETDNIEPALVNELLLYVNSLASIYHKPPSTFIGGVKDRRLVKTPALHIRDFVKRTDTKAKILDGREDKMAEQIGDGEAFFGGENNDDAGAGANGGGPGVDVLGALDPMFYPGTPFGMNPGMPFGANNQQVTMDGMQLFGALPKLGNVYENLGLLGRSSIFQ